MKITIPHTIVVRIIEKKTAAEPQSFAAPARVWFSGVVLSTIASKPLFNNSAINTMNNQRIRIAVSTVEFPTKKAAGNRKQNKIISCLNAISLFQLYFIPWIEYFVAGMIRLKLFLSGFMGFNA